MKRVISIILCVATLVAMLTVGAFAVDEEPTTTVAVTQEEQPSEGETDESIYNSDEDDPIYGYDEDEPSEENFNYFRNLWLAIQSTMSYTFFMPELLIATIIFGIAGPPLTFMTVGYSYLELFRAIVGIPINEEFCMTFKDGWDEVKRILQYIF